MLGCVNVPSDLTLSVVSLLKLLEIRGVHLNKTDMVLLPHAVLLLWPYLFFLIQFLFFIVVTELVLYHEVIIIKPSQC